MSPSSRGREDRGGSLTTILTGRSLLIHHPVFHRPHTLSLDRPVLQKKGRLDVSLVDIACRLDTVPGQHPVTGSVNIHETRFGSNVQATCE